MLPSDTGSIGDSSSSSSTMDLLVCLSSFGLSHVLDGVLAHLSSLDLRRAGRVSKQWNDIVARHWRHQGIEGGLEGSSGLICSITLV